MFHIIAAPATAPGIAGVSMIRVSGKDCVSLVDTIFCGKSSLISKNSHEIAYGKLINPITKEYIDEVMIGVFAHGRSFTGEESLEIWTHGSPYIVKEVMKVLGSLGIATAEPGEFSMRAFLNGKIDLTQAEAIKDLTESQTKFAHAQALGRLEGKLSSQIDKLHIQVLNLLALLEMSIDHAEEEFETEDLSDHYLKLINELLNNVNELISGAKVGKMSTDGIKVVLVGRPNVGKSSLLNALVQENRAIVSDVAGTTRDIIEHRISAHGLLIRFFDTAGLRETDDILEQEGTKRSLEALVNADLVLHIMDRSEIIQQEDKDILNILMDHNKYFLTVFNKSDLENSLKTDLLINKTKKIIEVSAILQNGVDLILEAISEYYFSGGIDPQNDIFVANVRQENLLQQSYEAISKGKSALLLKESEEFVAAHLRQARMYLEDIVGKTTNDVILDRIFSQFCIGK